MKNLVDFLLEKIYKPKNFYNDYFDALGSLGFLLKIIIFGLMGIMVSQYTPDISYTILGITFGIYIILLLWLGSGLRYMSFYISNPLLEFFIITIIIQIFLILFKHWTDLNCWYFIVGLWILSPVYFLCLFGIHMGGP